MSKKVKGLLILLFSYIIAFVIGLLTFIILENKVHIMVNLLISNIVSTIIIWIIGIFFKSASIYDPYWSIQTPVIYLCLLIKYQNFNL